MTDSAVLFIIFNRPSTTQKVFTAIAEAKPSRLYIAADAPRIGNHEDIRKCEQARLVTERIDWPCSVKRLYQKQNLGCSLGPQTAFNWFFQEEKEGIILEDDCVPQNDFFLFASEMLELYRENKKILSINGSNLGYELKDGKSYTFSRFMNMWGWATWADRATKIDYSLNSWKYEKHPIKFLHKRLRQHWFDLDINWYKYWANKFDLTINNDKKTWWDWQWIYYQIRNKKYSIVPAVNLVSNIGFNEHATHTKDYNNPSANIKSCRMNFPLIHPKNIKIDLGYEENYVKWAWCYYKRLPLLFYIKNGVKKLLTSYYSNLKK